jgi:hypothetical protein
MGVPSHNRLKGKPGTPIDYTSHRLAIAHKDSHYFLLIEHGMGRCVLSLPEALAIVPIDFMPNEVAMYRYLYSIYDLAEDMRKQAGSETANQYVKAFVNGTLKKRKVRDSDKVKVWIER